MTVVTLLLLACAPEPERADGFVRDTTVRVTSPANGEAVGGSFVVTYEAGAGVDHVRLYANARGQGPAERPEDGGGEIEVVVDQDGRYALALVGYDAAGVELSKHSLAVRVAGASESWVTVVSPADGANVPNPVQFVLDASDNVERVTLAADGWVFAEGGPGERFTYTFDGTGYARDIVVDGFDAAGALVASDSITLTVEPGTEPVDSDWNAVVLGLVEEYPTDGSYGYYWPEDDGVWFGTTREIWYRGERMSTADPYHRSFCVGLTWEVFMRAFDQVDRATGGDGVVNGMTVADMEEFRTDWFVRELYGAGAADAVENYGVGERVTDWADIRPGDVLQFWRHSGSGHNNLFVEWVYDGDGEIAGVTYWSTQSSTDGVGYNTEYFGTGGSSIDPSSFFAARVYMPEDWISWE